MSPGYAQRDDLNPLALPALGSSDAITGDTSVAIELSREMRDELLDPEGWSGVLDTYARTMGLAAALTDNKGRQLGRCLNPQPAWLLAQGAKPQKDPATREPACSFCLEPLSPCCAVEIALSTGRIETSRDRAGLVHLAVPLSLGQNRLGALVAGQAFDQYPEPLRLQRLARSRGVSAQQIWQEATRQLPIRNATLQVYGELLHSLGTAFLRQRYAAILDRKLAQTSLRLRLLLDGVEGRALFTLSATGLITSWNRGAERIFGYTEGEIIGQDFAGFFTPDDFQIGAPGKLLQQAKQDGVASDHGWQVRKDGTRFFAEGSLTVLGDGSSREFGRLTIDVTDRRKSEEALRQAQKLESIGVLASGIAHDFNNLLTGIMSGVSFARTCLPPEHPVNETLGIVEQATEKAADLTHQLLAYAGHGKFVVTRFDLSSLIRDMLKLLQTSIPKAVELRLDLTPDLPWIEADASQIQQIVMNLIINGAESIDPGGGWLRVSTSVVPTPTRSDGEAALDYVCLEIQDSGSGMTDATKARIFDPFFTTKFAGRGLGLAAVSGIVRGHDGTMEVESTLGEGSTFRICFPAIDKSDPSPAVAPRPCHERASGTVLVVDDEPALRSLAKAILEHCGYKVLVAQDGRDAVEQFRSQADSISAVLLDMTMPVMSGAEAFRLIREIRPDVPIVVSTGFSEMSTRESFGVGAVLGFVQKPYTAARLCERIRATSRTLPLI